MYLLSVFAWNDKNSSRTKTLLFSHARNSFKRFSPVPSLWLKEAVSELNLSGLRVSINGRFMTKGSHTASNFLWTFYGFTGVFCHFTAVCNFPNFHFSFVTRCFGGLMYRHL